MYNNSRFKLNSYDDFNRSFNNFKLIFVLVAAFIFCVFVGSIFFNKQMYDECLKQHSKYYCMKDLSSHRINITEVQDEK